MDSKWKKLEDSRQNLLKKLNTISHEKLNSGIGHWSVAQIFYHLNQAEKFSTIYVSKKMLDVKNLEVPNLWQRIKLAYLGFLFRTSKKFKAPEKVLGPMPENVDFKTILAEWDQTRINLRKLLDDFSKDLIDKNVFKQPAIGRLSLPQMLDFMQMHFERHARQIKERLNSV